MTGLLDLTSPLLSTLDEGLSPLLAPAWRVAVWGLVAACISMALYALLSPQRRLRHVKAGAEDARRALDSHEGSLGEAMPLIAAMLRRALAQLGLVLGPAVLASLPVLFVIVWMSGAFGHFIPSSLTVVPLSVEPQGLAARWIEPQRSGGTPAGDAVVQAAPEAPRALIEVIDAQERVVDSIAFSEPVTSLHKRHWWNLLIANPLGYLPAEGALERVEIALPRQEIIGMGPDWLRGWEVLFFTALVGASLAIKLVFRLV
ncbi:hypothetical protein [Pelagibius sp.]|uniref:hypothetical protein n=1 Tax=Pelagibius sp. TaxID=1931238 RepID=UPI002628A0D7|nr:hypothetical protein [Pelagibius sp.]